MKKIFPFIGFLFFVISLSAQYGPKENFYDAEFFFAEEDYEEALYAFTQVYNDGFQDNANINYRIGVCLLEINGRKTEAIPYLLKAVEGISEKYREGSFKEEHAPPDALLYLGTAYRIDYQMEKACEYYKKFLEFVEPGSSEEVFTRLQIEACQNAGETIKDPVDYSVGNLGQVNDRNVPIYNLTVSGDMNTVAFMGKHKFYNGVYVARKLEDKWLRPLNITPSIQSDGNQDVLSLSQDGNMMLLAWNDEFDSEIWYTVWENDRWNKSIPIGDPINSRFFESHACLTPDGETIYFTSNRRESIGEMDIFRCSKNEEGEWGEIELLGENVNTILNEDKPFVSPDGKRLYFSSQGHPGIGGFDIFYAEIKPDGTVGEPVSLGYPLNTTDDDFPFMPKQIGYDGYLTAYANGEKGQVDLLRLEVIPDDAEPVAVAFLPEETGEEVVEVVEEAVDEAGEVMEEVTEEVVEEVVEEVTGADEAGPEEAEAVSYIIRPVFFGFDSDALSDNARSKLDDLVIIMKKFPEASLSINGHTDAVGSLDYNMGLSSRRSESVRKYLVANGIAADRLTVNPYGETKHIALNRTTDDRDAPKGRALNRRVEFNITNTSDAVSIEHVDVPDHLKIK